MNISPQTMKILLNYAMINNSIFIKQTVAGEDFTKIRTKSKDSYIYSDVIVPEIFPKDVCFYELNKFITSLGLLGEDSIIDYADNYALLKNKSNSIKLVYTDPSMIIMPDPNKRLQDMEVEVAFTLTQKDFKGLLDASKTLQLPDIEIVSSGGKVTVKASNHEILSTNTYEVEVENPITTTDGKYVIKRELLTILPGDYRIELDYNRADFYNLSMEGSELRYTVTLEDVN